MTAVGRAADAIAEEVRRDSRPDKPEYGNAVGPLIQAKEIILPSLSRCFRPILLWVPGRGAPDDRRHFGAVAEGAAG
jgi:Na+/H+-translocating membrane pyrophosphatase